jgi:hypothetical protein
MKQFKSFCPTHACTTPAMKQRGDDGDGEDEDNGEDDRATLDDVRYWMQGRIKRTKLFIE